MKVSFYGTDGTEELSKASQALKAFSTLSRSQKARLTLQEPYIPPAPPPVSAWIRYQRWGKEILKTLLSKSLFIIVAAFIVLGLHSAWNFLAGESPVISAQAPLTAVEGRPTPATAWRLEPGHWFSVINLEGKEVLSKWMGWVPGTANLPKEGNSIGDCYMISGDTHYWIWAAPAGDTTAAWIDP